MNLLGGDYYVHHYAKAGETGTERMRDVGGLIDYHNTGYHDWYGGWARQNTQLTHGQQSLVARNLFQGIKDKNSIMKLKEMNSQRY